ncbi:pyridoxal phosphate-dependent aminotransferase [Metaclostridioides mangenotii]|uniref:Aminotransferase n=1 Tax=Metaclostridioides mangenotii TaxID=1540 RepID=A0ABS4EEQ4_9FIRM|nr:pyridoxal phosphate-dependent aminotransferase [Clostridioides mangenotii]MBP1856423.1 aspartate aminotransferase [Clostridioides mangenotii]
MLSDRLNFLTPSYTVGISSKVKEMKKNGIDVINLSIGEPDFNVPEKAKSYGIDSLNMNYTKYDLVPGLAVLREEICNKLEKENKCNYTPDEIVVTSGAKTSITNAILAITNYGDEVILPKPYWVSYPETIKLLGAVPAFLDTKKENGFKVTKEELEQAITSKSKAIVITNPSNPTGSVYTKKELEDIIDVCIKNSIYIIADEIYEKICYVEEFTSVASLSEEAKNITITINGFSKSAAMTGLRVGYTASNKEIAKAMSSIQGHLVSHPSQTSQYIAYGALKECSKDIDRMIDTYRYRRNLIVEKLDSMDNVGYVNPDGAFYAFIDLSKVAEKYDFKDSFSIEFCAEFLEKCRVAVVPGKAFGLDNYVRISYACNEKDFLEGLNRMEQFISSIM